MLSVSSCVTPNKMLGVCNCVTPNKNVGVSDVKANQSTRAKDQFIQIETIATFDNNNINNNYVTTIPSSPGSGSCNTADMVFLYERPSSCFMITLQVIASVFLCLPFGVMAVYYAIKVRSSLSKGDKFRAHVYETYVKNLFKTSCVVGVLFWFIIILVLIVQFVILKRSTEQEIVI